MLMIFILCTIFIICIISINIILYKLYKTYKLNNVNKLIISICDKVAKLYYYKYSDSEEIITVMIESAKRENLYFTNDIFSVYIMCFYNLSQPFNLNVNYTDELKSSIIQIIHCKILEIEAKSQFDSSIDLDSEYILGDKQYDI